MTVVVKTPSSCTDSEIAAFCSLVRQIGEADPGGLENRVRSALALVFLHRDGQLAGIAALRAPGEPYKAAIFHLSGVDADPAAYGADIGWVFVPESHRGKHLSRLLVDAALSRAKGINVFAISKPSNAPMNRTLEHFGFARAGRPWYSSRGNYDLVLYVRNSGAGVSLETGAGRPGRAP